MSEPLSLLDRVEIEELIARYNWAIDTSDGPGLADTFTADGAFVGTREFRGREALIGFGAGTHHGPIPPAQHWVTNMVLEGDTELARLKAYFVRQNVEDGQVITTNLGYYDDELVRVEGRWLFSVRRFILWPPAAARDDR
jgi:hypothetical protein